MNGKEEKERGTEQWMTCPRSQDEPVWGENTEQEAQSSLLSSLLLSPRSQYYYSFPHKVTLKLNG